MHLSQNSIAILRSLLGMLLTFPPG